jgi:hypothetical protein
MSTMSLLPIPFSSLTIMVAVLNLIMLMLRGRQNFKFTQEEKKDKDHTFHPPCQEASMDPSSKKLLVSPLSLFQMFLWMIQMFLLLFVRV